MQIYSSQFKGTDAVIMENDALKVTFLPTIGGKMASLIDPRRENPGIHSGDERRTNV